MKKYFFSLLIIISGQIFSQDKNVGIDTNNPKSLLHVDGEKDNPKIASEIITAAQIANDIMVTKEGNIGIGVLAPTTKLDIYSSTDGALKLVDGTQGANKVLMSDANGIATWQTLNSLKAVVPGVFPSAGTQVQGDGTLNNFGAVKYTQTYIDLTPGNWLVNIGLTVRSKQDILNRFWLHGYLSTSTISVIQNGFTHLGPAGSNTSFSNLIFGNPARTNNTYTSDGTNMLSGSSFISVIANTRIYLLLDDANTLPTQNGEKVGHWQFNTASWENYFYAIPIE
ncbi:hypothetical protein [Chryseobacterium sp.]|uniref:hypothetical protein n=1 Tax=Chryseobacterium sp. TaxID=1871047 RepID=UPI00388F4128